HELILAAEVLIERRLRRVGLRQHAVDTHSPHALPVEQAVGGIEEAVTDADCGGFRPFPRFLRHLLTIQTDRSIVNVVDRQNGLFSVARTRVPRSGLARREAVRSFDKGYALSGKTALVT